MKIGNHEKRSRMVVRIIFFAFISGLLCFTQLFAEEVQLKRLDNFARRMYKMQYEAVGYPVNQNTDLKEFYEWYLNSELYEVSMNNVGDPQEPSLYAINTHEFEKEVIDFFAPLYGFSSQDAWGIVTMSGTDGNNHGMYFGVKQLLGETKMLPICYVSAEAHYSIKKLADLQNLELRIIKTDETGKMVIGEFEKALDPSKPALIVIAMGTTFKGAIDDQAAIDEVLRRKKPVAVYRHVDAALFGGYLPFTRYKDLVNRKVFHFDSIAVSGHKFFGLDEPMGIFICTKKTRSALNPFKVSYLNQAVPTITCSRDAVAALKFWWKVKKTGMSGFKEQANAILANARYLEAQLKKIGWPDWRNDFSNTVYFRRPSADVMKKYQLPPEVDPRLGGDLAHIVVMQHISRDVIDQIVNDIKTCK
ncbi:MAG: aminotransferase class V-fold PLP-dependent enzyme [Candidatus Omnitrophica bacterium]|nr:aminotransferase class V-fold PLP-dependent enzyme [Candidatus Omnitrophota bacterium]